MPRIALILCVVLLGAYILIEFSCVALDHSGVIAIKGYDADKLIVKTLPHPLQEVSGIAFDSTNGMLIAINDEKGCLFVLDTLNNVKATIPFAGTGDYEDVVINKGRALALKSDGDIYLIEQYTSDTPPVKHFRYRGCNAEFETLIWDKRVSRYLLVSKICTKHKNNCIYSFSPATGSFSLYDKQINRREFKIKTGMEGFHPSGGAIDRDNNLLMLSAMEHVLIKLDKNWVITDVFQLNKDVLPQPEGIAFDMRGQLYLSTEAAGGKPKLISIPPVK